MAERLPCEFFLVRYVPDPVKGEFTNIGVVLREAAAGSAVQVRFTRDWARVRCMDAHADTEMLEALEAELNERLRTAPAQGMRPLMQVLEDSFSNSIQITEPRACLAESVPAEMDQLMELYVEPMRVRQAKRASGRAAIAAAMRRRFEATGAWQLMRKRIPAAAYTHPGDPLRLDCGYRPNGVIRIFHAVSLEGDVESAKVLAYTAPRLREGIARVESATLDLAAVVEPIRVAVQQDPEAAEDAELDADGVARYRFGVETMEEQGIRVLTMNDLARAADTARQELRI